MAVSRTYTPSVCVCVCEKMPSLISLLKQTFSISRCVCACVRAQEMSVNTALQAETTFLPVDRDQDLILANRGHSSHSGDTSRVDSCWDSDRFIVGTLL